MEVPTSTLPKFKEAGERYGSGIVPVPVSVAICGLLLALSVTVTEPLDKPGLVGAKVTAILHVVLAFRDAGQLSPSENGPVDKMFVILKETDELLVRVSTCGALAAPTFVSANDTELGDRLAAGAIPIPVSMVTCGLLLPECMTVSDKLKLPTVTGLSVTVIVQEELGPRDDGQLFV